MQRPFNKILIILLLLFIIFPLYSNDKKILNFAPLPTNKASKNIQEFLAMSAYLKEDLSLEVKYIYKRGYQDIFNGFKDGSIDITYFDPLAFITLKKEYKFVKLK